jgi:hypothetical protein
MQRHKVFSALLLTFLLVIAANAKEPPAQVIVWPDSGPPVLRFSFSRLKEVGASGSQHNYNSDTTAENLWGKPISRADFSLYLFDKKKVRIGEGWISVSNVGLGETVKFQTSVSATGTPVSIALAPRSLPGELQSFLPAKTISITVNSVPQGAVPKVDGTDAGTTSKMVKVGLGKHLLECAKEGFNAGKFPMEVGPDDVSGGSVSYELGTSAHDTIELRDGSVLTGDLVSVSGMDMVVHAGGNDQRLNRNQVKRILLIERESSTQTSP